MARVLAVGCPALASGGQALVELDDHPAEEAVRQPGGDREERQAQVADHLGDLLVVARSAREGLGPDQSPRRNGARQNHDHHSQAGDGGGPEVLLEHGLLLVEWPLSRPVERTGGIRCAELI